MPPTGYLPVFFSACVPLTASPLEQGLGAPMRPVRTCVPLQNSSATYGRRFAMEDTDARQAVQESMDRRDQGESR